jgi:hypothetical protein
MDVTQNISDLSHTFAYPVAFFDIHTHRGKQKIQYNQWLNNSKILACNEIFKKFYINQ